jgi:hypothetical protein
MKPKAIFCRVCGKRVDSIIDPNHICIGKVKWTTGRGRAKKIKPWQLVQTINF